MLIKVRFKRIKMETVEAFLTLVRLGIGKNASKLPQKVDWPKVREFAERQGLYAIAIDGVEKLPAERRPPQELLLEWIGEVLQNYEYRYGEYKKTISEMAAFYQSHGFKMMVLKGYACSLDWPKPGHRPCGDIDIWQFGEQPHADSLIAKEKGIKVDNSHHHHSVFMWGEFMVENHYDFINVHHHKSHREFEKILKELGNDDSYSVEVCGERVCLPSPNLHSLFLLKHLMLHFSTGEITLRQLLDWAFFVEKHGKDVDWNWLNGVLDTFGMMPAFNIFNAICVEELGFEPSLFHSIQYNPLLKDRVLREILMPEYGGEMPNNLMKRVVYKWHRWKDSEWKHQLCYNESMWSAFWSGVWGHLIKPSSI